jgi:hypothetical protein
MEENYVIFNIFYKTTLEAFQELNKEKTSIFISSHKELNDKKTISSLFYKR